MYRLYLFSVKQVETLTNSTHKAAKQGGRRNATDENSMKSKHYR